MRGRRIRVALGAAVAALVLAACGTTEAPAGAPASPAPAGGAQVTVTDARGKQVTFDGPVTRAVGLEWALVEHLVSLGVMPVGVADVAGYSAWVQAAPLTADVTDVGVRGEPSIETIARLQPDVVFATPDMNEGAIAQIEAFAPVVVMRDADASDAVGQMRRNVELVAQVTGKQAQAAQLLAGFDAAVADGAQRIAAAGLAGRRIAFADGYLDGGRLSIRAFTDGSLIGTVTRELGLVNAWAMKGDESYGTATTDVEGLTTLGDVEFVYWTNKVEGPDPFVDGLAGNAVWQSLPFVQAGNVERLPDGIWMFGGPASMRQYIDAITVALAG
ncbi:iron-siderophore ABC transporter substrate-binding protein [Pseudonocardia cypriaca]|uniref:Iron complex transport system substrate-binding protein n=1 Tax=Pseudonocardia cypriaca TaxID=882449 RepID=A0A543G9G4_9PSEU|nr:iron-siderophore ABC transporter substrate-binding protein [Pseudonocardia cypriaca]TQM42729.1 iron complex transport system substrate-binding protein [Pseudonocardia cypriaca]